jgi:hypothetical protein
MVKAFIKNIANLKSGNRYRDMEPVLTAIFKQNNLPLAFHLDGNTNLELLKSKIESKEAEIGEEDPNRDFRVFSVVIGVSNYLQIAKLRYGHLDAKLFSEMLANVYRDKFKKEDQFVFLDSNVNLLNLNSNAQTSKYMDSILNNGFLQTIFKSTRIQNQTNTLIDHILSNKNPEGFSSGTVISDISDHFFSLNTIY